MNEEQQLKLQAFLDGELPEDEAREVSALLARDEEATALSKELRNTRQALKGSETNMRLPESREFYWSKIQREIERSERKPVERKRGSIFQTLRRILVPAGAVAMVAIMGILAGHQIGWLGISSRPDAEMTVADSGAFTYQDHVNGTTLVWVSYPAER
jgi:anti-sigma factor RsiW